MSPCTSIVKQDIQGKIVIEPRFLKNLPVWRKPDIAAGWKAGEVSNLLQPATSTFAGDIFCQLVNICAFWRFHFNDSFFIMKKLPQRSKY